MTRSYSHSAAGWLTHGHEYTLNPDIFLLAFPFFATFFPPRVSVASRSSRTPSLHSISPASPLCSEKSRLHPSLFTLSFSLTLSLSSLILRFGKNDKKVRAAKPVIEKVAHYVLVVSACSLACGRKPSEPSSDLAEPEAPPLTHSLTSRLTSVLLSASAAAAG